MAQSILGRTSDGKFRFVRVDNDGYISNPAASVGTYQWLSTDPAPALGASDRAYGIEINTSTHVQTVKYWNGSSWEVLA